MSAETTDAPTLPGDGSLCIHNDWFESGWPVVMPLHQAMWAVMLLSTATARQLRGDLDAVAVLVFGDDPRRAPRGIGGQGLESPLVWPDAEAVEAADSPEEAARITADAQTHRAWCEEALRAAGLPAPSTVRDLATVMERLGIARCEDGRWTMPDCFPRPEDVLRLPEELLGRLRSLRRVQDSGPAERALLHHITHTLGRPAQFITTLQRLKQATGFGAGRLRDILDHLATGTGEIKLYRGRPPVTVAAKDLTGQSRFLISLDWARIDEGRNQTVRIV
ncbi:hypothetical protein OEIGOIKO_00586 [Streptomyces chrestomyceticus JCM 4735]|uniref:Uncharacterized protein n=1 Tax=Streptomyces chrestomyceticus JCM 4735 TaxID=1306181 RepID=A0A7U9KQS6_9ACTN|nr:DUF6042 family protein [Streptomyces chrestomyceticus]GCD32868.1 hypothetical protein OEIGOIKO_00586 [Streptomyces chrestomyceticus JCM 4735]